ncbi:response regulator transcription factor [Paenibacillus glycanilyticus]|uniref:response regulator transcription factor n=1 Tax=Paenibacillus glycanilyticus TaxID=126569 RepID=UPI0019106021|nr:response regulator transcription factor [Paenibacillus glycanilyticus]
MSDKIMVIEDEKKIADAIAYALQREGYLVDVVNRGDMALERLPLFQPDALILDVMLPGTDGYEILKKLREKGRRVGVIMLTAKEDIVHKVLGLELGADDYLTKPFDMRELLARLKSLLRRLQAAEEKPQATELSLGEVVLQLNKRTAFVGTRALDLTPKEYDLLTLLLSSPEQVFSREQLLDRVWGLEYIGGTRTVDIHVQRLRKKLGEESGKMILTVHGVGYKTLGGYRDN